MSVGLVRFPHAFIVPDFLRLVLNSPLMETQFDRIKVGGATHTNKLHLGDLHCVALPVPPLAEQHRIVAKIDELMALCDRLEPAQAERERRRDRVSSASLARLNETNATRLRDCTSSHLQQHVHHLTRHLGQLRQLRQTVFNLAIRGCLVPQRSDDEAAEKVLGPRKLVPGTSQAPWTLPRGWAWSSLRLIGESRGGGTPSKANPQFWTGADPLGKPQRHEVRCDFRC